jgi:uncharacterized membrane protein
MNIALRMIVGALLFATALIASSWLLKGTPTKDWVNAALYIGFACYFVARVLFAVQKKT